MKFYAVYQHSNSMLSLKSTFESRAENGGVCCCFPDLESRTNLRNRSNFEILSNSPTPSKLIQTIDTIRKRLKLKQQWLAQAAWHYQLRHLQELLICRTIINKWPKSWRCNLCTDSIVLQLGDVTVMMSLKNYNNLILGNLDCPGPLNRPL